jgi:predicted dithiol-disulfide oxidoreductase (DUF899 family)
VVDVVAHEEWIAARKTFLVKEKEFSRLRDDLNAERRRLPRERVVENYVFDAAGGERTLEELFGRCSQLIVYHFMFPPEWDAGCPHCSFWADSFNGIAVHLRARDVSFVAVSRAPYSKLAAYQRRMGWDFEWVSSLNNKFNFDYYASFTPEQLAEGTAFYNYAESHGSRAESTEVAGVSVFYKDESGQVLHTYSTFARGIDMVNGAYHYLDLVPNGRDEQGHDSPQFWVHRHDEY